MHAHARGRPELGIWFEPAEDVVAPGVSIVVDDAVRAAADRLLFGDIVVRLASSTFPVFSNAIASSAVVIHFHPRQPFFHGARASSRQSFMA